MGRRCRRPTAGSWPPRAPRTGEGLRWRGRGCWAGSGRNLGWRGRARLERSGGGLGGGECGAEKGAAGGKGEKRGCREVLSIPRRESGATAASGTRGHSPRKRPPRSVGESDARCCVQEARMGRYDVEEGRGRIGGCSPEGCLPPLTGKAEHGLTGGGVIRKRPSRGGATRRGEVGGAGRLGRGQEGRWWPWGRLGNDSQQNLTWTGACQ